jgi:hypothetical protein
MRNATFALIVHSYGKDSGKRIKSISIQDNLTDGHENILREEET